MLDHHDVVLQGNMVVTSYTVMCALSSLLVFPGDGGALGCVVYASSER